MRRHSTLIVGLVMAIAALPAPALAHPPDRMTDTQTSVECLDLTSDAGAAAFLIGVSDEFGAFAQVGFWEAGSVPFEESPTWFGSTDQVVVAADGSSLSATVDMYAFSEEMPEGVLIGTASIVADTKPTGPRETFRDTSDGTTNVRFVLEGTSQALAVSGRLDLPEAIGYDLVDCAGSTTTTTRFVTNPDAQVMRNSLIELNCVWETDSALVVLSAVADQFGSLTDLFISDASGDYAGFGEATLTDTEFAAAFELIDITTVDGGPVGTASASAVLSASGEREHDRFSFEDTKVHVQRNVLTATGTLMISLPAGDASYAMDASSCVAADTRAKQITTSPNGPKAQLLANDLPADAAPIGIGEAVSVSTGGTAIDPEGPCLVEGVETGEVIELEIGHTAWWSFEGTGGQVTIDTVGSDFDTVLGVYSASLDHLDCVDDVDSLQARITVDTVAGITYLVQVGGLGGESGALELRLD
ncbi:MAG: hypothetical protein ACRDGD_01200 [Candidatus Limnocylindria bacterium]